MRGKLDQQQGGTLLFNTLHYTALFEFEHNKVAFKSRSYSIIFNIFSRSVPERADPSQSCSPITLEYAEELLLMAYDGRCSVMDVSQVPKENPSGSRLLTN